MTIPPIDPSAVLGAEWRIPGIDAAGGVGSPTAPGVGAGDGVAPAGGSFGSALTQQISKLSELQDTAATASQSLADGTATDVSSVVMAVEKAQLAMQLASRIRTKGAEALTDILHTQI